MLERTSVGRMKYKGKIMHVCIDRNINNILMILKGKAVSSSDKTHRLRSGR